MGEVRHWYKNLLRGRVYFDNRRESIDCLVGDISAQGARIIFSDEVTIPDFIDLNIPQREQTIHACVEWHVGNELGLSFIDAAHASSAPLEFGYYLARRVAQLELELASLRRAIKRLTGLGHYKRISGTINSSQASHRIVNANFGLREARRRGAVKRDTR